MKRRVKVCLTGVSEKLTDEAEKKLNNSEESILEPVCDNGHTLEYYEDIGMPQNKIPKELIERKKTFELGIQLEDDDYEEVLFEVVVYEDEVTHIAQDIETETTLIYLKNLLIIRVLEEPFEINSIINYTFLNWFERKWLDLRTLFRKDE
jgi:hypothetical protein